MNTTQAQLGAVLAAGGPELTRLLDETEQRLAAVAGGYGDVLAGHAEGTLAAGGKRLRPILVFLCGAGDRERLVAAASAVELLHMATLVHDDVLDRARCGAGTPPCSRPRASRPPPPPATFSSPGPSPSWRDPAGRTR